MNETNPKKWRTNFSTPFWRRAGLTGGILLSAAIISSVILFTGPDGSPQEQHEKAWPVTIVRAVPAALNPMFATYGRVEARSQAQLRANLRSSVADVLVREGEWVEQGDLLIRLQADETKLQLREAFAEKTLQQTALDSLEREFSVLQKNSAQFRQLFELAQGKLERQRVLADSKMIPQSLFDAAIEQAARDTLEYQAHLSAVAAFPNQIAQQAARLEKANVAVEQAELNLAKTEIRAPFSGPVLAVAANPGNIAQIGAELVTIADATSFEIRAAIPDQYTQRIRGHLNSGNAITAQTDGGSYQLQLSRVSQSVRTGQGSLDAFFAFAPDQLRTGTLPDLGRVLNLNAVLPTEPQLVALPSQAIYENNRIYTVQDSRLQAQSVERVGEFRAADGSYKILVRGSSLTNTSEVVTTQLPKAITGLLVEPILSSTETQDSRPELSPDEAMGCTTTHGLTTIVHSRTSPACQSAAWASLT